ncbi:hypothetical protein PAHAL_3G502500 [Panicum hallii]|uniref:Uncharacterized protein n=1 Tax=Panicum hallii TaxID=206008 RepID=A0A2T8KM28_9POAL|nr:hypothetical protein PAHAL_3G502500 [Panicum hallii]
MASLSTTGISKGTPSSFLIFLIHVLTPSSPSLIVLSSASRPTTENKFTLLSCNRTLCAVLSNPAAVPLGKDRLMMANLVHHGRPAAVVAWQGLVDILHLANPGGSKS